MANRNLKKAITLIRHANEALEKANELLRIEYDNKVWVGTVEASVAWGLNDLAKELDADVVLTPNEDNTCFYATFTVDGVTFHEYCVPIEWADKYTGGK